jgi:hypothetical protein
MTPNSQRARYYSLTPAGKQQLGLETEGFAALVSAVKRVMRPA